MAVRSLRTRLLALWLMLATSAGVTGYLLLEFYQQSANAQVSRAEDAVARGCRDIGDRYAFFVTGWTGAAAGDIDEALKRQLTEVVQAALLRATGVEGGLWQPLLGAEHRVDRRDPWRSISRSMARRRTPKLRRTRRGTQANALKLLPRLAARISMRAKWDQIRRTDG
jgi:hypothetical protein